MNPLRSLTLRCLLGACVVLLDACATAQPDATHPATVAADVPAEWQAPLPHGASTDQLQQWWRKLGDPVLVELIQAAEQVSPTLASAQSNVVQSRSTRALALASNRPTLDANLSAQRGLNSSFPTAGTLYQGSLDASWEIDLFGSNRATASAAQARLQGAQAQWHVARVSVAAETASDYWGWHSCNQQLALLAQDTQSHTETARLATLSAQAGMGTPAAAALANAATAESQARLTQQQNQCDSLVKALVALTAIPEPAMRTRLREAPAQLSPAALPAVDAVPARVLAQRPDVYAAERDVAAASADLGAAQSKRYPRLTLAGSIGGLSYQTEGVSTDLSTWSIGPVALNLPIFDGGRIAANVDSATARYTEAAALYRAKVRQAAREVEDALLTLAASTARVQQADAALAGYQTAFDSTQARWHAGTANVPDLEDARRTLLSAQSELLQRQLDRNNAWVGLYRALGGGWTGADAPPP